MGNAYSATLFSKNSYPPPNMGFKAPSFCVGSIAIPPVLPYTSPVAMNRDEQPDERKDAGSSPSGSSSRHAAFCVAVPFSEVSTRDQKLADCSQIFF